MILEYAYEGISASRRSSPRFINNAAALAEWSHTHAHLTELRLLASVLSLRAKAEIKWSLLFRRTPYLG
jgi:hypothetical protein